MWTFLLNTSTTRFALRSLCLTPFSCAEVKPLASHPNIVGITIVRICRGPRTHPQQILQGAGRGRTQKHSILCSPGVASYNLHDAAIEPSFAHDLNFILHFCNLLLVSGVMFLVILHAKVLLSKFDLVDNARVIRG